MIVYFTVRRPTGHMLNTGDEFTESFRCFFRLIDVFHRKMQIMSEMNQFLIADVDSHGKPSEVSGAIKSETNLLQKRTSNSSYSPSSPHLPVVSIHITICYCHLIIIMSIVAAIIIIIIIITSSSSSSSPSPASS